VLVVDVDVAAYIPVQRRADPVIARVATPIISDFFIYV